MACLNDLRAPSVSTEKSDTVLSLLCVICDWFSERLRSFCHRCCSDMSSSSALCLVPWSHEPLQFICPHLSLEVTVCSWHHVIHGKGEGGGGGRVGARLSVQHSLTMYLPCSNAFMFLSCLVRQVQTLQHGIRCPPGSGLTYLSWFTGPLTPQFLPPDSLG